MAEGYEVEFDAVTKRFSGSQVLTDVSFKAPPGQITCLLGPNGAGKSTLLRTLLGLVGPTDGCALIDGRGLFEFPKPALVVGAVFESFGMNPSWMVRTCLRVRSAEIGLRRDDEERIYSRIGLEGTHRRRIGKLSLGMKQRLAIGVAILGSPPVLVLDEPFNGLDPEGLRWATTVLREEAQRGATVLVSSHLLKDMELIADRAILLHRGTVTALGTIDEIRTSAGLDSRVLVEADDAARLVLAVGQAGGEARLVADGVEVLGLGSLDLLNVARASGVQMRLISTETSWLEASYFRLASDGRRLHDGRDWL